MHPDPDQAQDQTPPVLEARGLRPAVRDWPGDSALSLVLLPGQVAALLGPAGPWRDSLMRCLAGLDWPGSGEVNVGGRPAWSLPSSGPRPGWLGAAVRLPGSRTVRECLRPEATERLAAALGLEPVLDLPVSHLSQMIARRVALASELTSFEPLVMVDDPCPPHAGPGPRRAAELDDLAAALSAVGRSLGTAVVYAASAADVVTRSGSHLWRLPVRHGDPLPQALRLWKQLGPKLDRKGAAGPPAGKAGPADPHPAPARRPPATAAAPAAPTAGAAPGVRRRSKAKSRPDPGGPYLGWLALESHAWGGLHQAPAWPGWLARARDLVLLLDTSGLDGIGNGREPGAFWPGMGAPLAMPARLIAGPGYQPGRGGTVQLAPVAPGNRPVGATLVDLSGATPWVRSRLVEEGPRLVLARWRSPDDDGALAALAGALAPHRRGCLPLLDLAGRAGGPAPPFAYLRVRRSPGVRAVWQGLERALLVCAVGGGPAGDGSAKGRAWLVGGAAENVFRLASLRRELEDEILRALGPSTEVPPGLQAAAAALMAGGLRQAGILLTTAGERRPEPSQGRAGS